MLTEWACKRKNINKLVLTGKDNLDDNKAKICLRQPYKNHIYIEYCDFVIVSQIMYSQTD